MASSRLLSSRSLTSAIAACALSLAVFVCFVQTGDAIFCWECNSHYDPNCADPFRNKTFSETNCDMRSLDHFPNKKATVCRKTVQKVKDDYRFIRGCGFLSSEKESINCIKRAGTFNVLIQYCSCNSDKCNGSNNLSAGSLWSVALMGAIALFRGDAVK